jgi:alpha-tubulin suppressor-like RCC1 family protein
VLAWGDTGSGELGSTPLAEFETRAQPRQRSRTPAAVDVQFEAVDVSCRSDHVLALARDGSVYSWGRGAAGQLGIGPLPAVAFKTQSARVMPFIPYPVRIPDLAGVKAISTGNTHSLALLEDGTVRAWGENRWGQVGDGTTMNRDRPTMVQGVRNAVAIAAAGEQSAAVLADGTAVEWGSTLGNRKPRPTPTPVPAARGLKSIVAGGAHFAALTQTGEVMTWGADAHYEIGRGGNPLAAALVPGVTNAASLAAAHSSTIAVMSSGRIVTWGEVRPWTRPGNGQRDLSPSPILLWIDGLDQP